MKVSELITKLQNIDPDATVLVWDPKNDTLTDKTFITEQSITFDNKKDVYVIIDNERAV